MKIAFINNGPFYPNFRNFNYYQRVYFLSEWTSLVLFVGKKTIVSNELKNKCFIIESKFSGKAGFFLFLLTRLFYLRKFDLIITEPSTFTVFGFLAKLLYNKKWVIDIWDIPFRDLTGSWKTKIKRKIQVLFFRPIFRRADLYIVSILPDFQLSELRLPREKKRCFMNAIFLEEYEKLREVEPFEKFTILIQRSRFYKGFGVELMLDAFSRVLQKVDARLLIAGHLMPEVQQIIDQYPHRDKLIVPGFVDHDEFKRLALKSHVCVIPYPRIVDLQQIYPIKAIEFMALGKAIVATKIAGLERLIGDAGILVNPIKPENLAKEILYLHDHPEERKKLEKKAKMRSRNFDARSKNQAIFNELKKLVHTSN